MFDIKSIADLFEQKIDFKKEQLIEKMDKILGTSGEQLFGQLWTEEDGRSVSIKGCNYRILCSKMVILKYDKELEEYCNFKSSSNILLRVESLGLSERCKFSIYKKL